MTQDGRWVYARDLQVDDVVRSHSFGTQKISALEISLTQTMVYNFLTDDLHNYAVGQNGILVHNTNLSIKVDVKKSEIQAFQKRCKLNGKWDSEKNLQLYANRNTSVQEYVSKFRRSSIKEVLPEEAKVMSVESAIRSGKIGGVNVRKLLLDLRDKFVK
jgi:hypothetical protein